MEFVRILNQAALEYIFAYYAQLFGLKFCEIQFFSEEVPGGPIHVLTLSQSDCLDKVTVILRDGQVTEDGNGNYCYYMYAKSKLGILFQGTDFGFNVKYVQNGIYEVNFFGFEADE